MIHLRELGGALIARPSPSLQPKSTSLPDRVSSLYEAKVRDGAIEPDAAQRRLVKLFDDLSDELSAFAKLRRKSVVARIFAKKLAIPRGLYIWGEVGRGKTMLMDLFYDSLDADEKRRVHFHEFMQDVHARIHNWRLAKKEGRALGDDPIAPLAEDLIQHAWLLCFDEFVVTDIADAMLLGRLFTALFDRGCVVVATSNVEPSQLYRNGLNRALFLPFIKLLQERVDVFRLDARTDFRLEKLDNLPIYHYPADHNARGALTDAFHSLSGDKVGRPMVLQVLGRELTISQAANHVARFSFDELCGRPLGAADYLAIADNFHTIVLDGAPAMTVSQRNEAKRFINLIDTLYDRRVKLIISAAAPPQDLYVADSGVEAFEFQRTVSRLIEMQSRDYLALPHGLADSGGSGDATGLVET